MTERSKEMLRILKEMQNGLAEGRARLVRKEEETSSKGGATAKSVRKPGRRAAGRRRSDSRIWMGARWKIKQGGKVFSCRGPLRADEKNGPRRKERMKQPRQWNCKKKNEEETDCPRRNRKSLRMVGSGLHDGLPMNKRRKKRRERTVGRSARRQSEREWLRNSKIGYDKTNIVAGAGFQKGGQPSMVLWKEFEKNYGGRRRNDKVLAADRRRGDGKRN